MKKFMDRLAIAGLLWGPVIGLALTWPWVTDWMDVRFLMRGGVVILVSAVVTWGLVKTAGWVLEAFPMFERKI